ncbi:hypothetical protein [Faecalispora jeddahensis]|uniref:hypothetical protein n=1 Tax=Faecalispora jeddahensis TaxID=1414721 RepID=UPI0027BA38E2|nr:hypothetical protein [Faecalispora jeddahensis]
MERPDIMPRIKRRTYAGSVCEQEVFTVPDRVKNLKAAEPRQRFMTDAEREKHKLGISRRHHARMVNENFSPRSLYSTLTLDNEHEVHTFEEARRIRDLYVRRLKYANPDARISIYMGRGKSTYRIHFHMLSDGIDEKTILEKWQAGSIVRVEPLRAHNYYNGVDHGQDYTGLANYLFDHWTPEQGGHRWKQTKNIRPPEREAPTVVKLNYSESRPPRAPKGYTLVECKSNRFGYLYFKYVRLVSEVKPPAGKRPPMKC